MTKLRFRKKLNLILRIKVSITKFLKNASNLISILSKHLILKKT